MRAPTAALALAATPCVRAFLHHGAKPISRPIQYAASRISRRQGILKATHDYGDYSRKIAFIFPGQGAQYVGMAALTTEEVPATKKLFEDASKVLGYDLFDKVTNGPKESLDSTAVSQPAIFVASAAAVEKLKATEGDAAVNQATVTMGLSLGEYTALWYAGAISFEDGVRLTKARGEAMQAAADRTESTMVSVIGLDSDKVSELCKAAAEKSGGKMQIANYLCPGNYACSGSVPAALALEEIAKPEFGARMTVRLAVAGAFHTDYMAPAVEDLKAVLATTQIKRPRIPVISNVDGQPHSDPEEIKDILARQVTSPVQWEGTMSDLIKEGLETAYELGPGRVCTGILRRIDRQATLINIEI